jgi:hypothetical protein
LLLLSNQADVAGCGSLFLFDTTFIILSIASYNKAERSTSADKNMTYCAAQPPGTHILAETEILQLITSVVLSNVSVSG